MNSHLMQRLSAFQRVLLAHRDGSLSLPNEVKGGEREIFIREFLAQIFPASRRFATGAITDAAGRISGQVDIAVEFGFSPSFPMTCGAHRLMLAESVATVIEVKSDVAKQWSEVRKTTTAVKALRREMKAIRLHDEAPPASCIPVIAVGYTGYKTRENLSERLKDTPESERPDGVLVIESGAFIGFGMTADGPAGLYALVLAIDVLFRGLISARPDLQDYLQ